MNIQTVNFKDVSFVNVTNPGDIEIKDLKKNYGFSSLHLDDFVHRSQTPKIEATKDYSLIVLDFPRFTPNGSHNTTEGEATNKTLVSKIWEATKTANSFVPLLQFPSGERKRRIISSQVDFFIGENYLVVLHDGALLPINDVFMECQKTLRNREEFMSQGSVFLAYRIIDLLVDSCFPVMNDITATIDRVDKELESRQSQSTIEDISVTRRNIVVFQTMTKPIIPLFRELEEGLHKELNGTMQQFWGNVLDHLQKIWDRLEDSRELIEGISESNESFLRSKTNEIVTVLTIFSAIILPLNLLASMYGMNVRLPLGDHPFVFSIIVLVMVGTALLMLLAFRSRRWF